MNSATTEKQREKTAEALRTRLGPSSIVFVGMPGSGKSSIGRRLAQRLRLPFIDADAEIETAAGMSIADIFAQHGEPYFRDGEARVIARLLESGPAVIATGGGAFLNPDTRTLVRERGISVWLKADIAVLLRRVRRKGDRPLLKGKDPEATLKRLLAEREKTYAEADIIITSRDGPHDGVIAAIIDALERRLQLPFALSNKPAEART